MTQPPDRVPTLTEVVAWPDSVQPAAAAQPAPDADIAPPPAVPAAPGDEQLAQRVLAEVQRQIDLTLEYRIRETLTPLLARFGDNLVREARHELASALRDVVARAVAQELARHRRGGGAR